MKLVSFFLVICMFFSCKKEHSQLDYYPIKEASMSQGTFDKYNTLLIKGYEDKDNFQVAIQLANLKSSPEHVFDYLNKSIDDDSKTCTKLYDLLYMYKDFKTNLVKSDTTQFLAACERCKKILGPDSYLQHKEMKEEEERQYLANREVLDSSKFDLTLMKELRQIETDDQRLRGQDFDKLSQNESDQVWKEINKIDSINLAKVDRILKVHGYPTKEKVGHDLSGTVWLVLHHQGDLAIRKKYRKYLAEAKYGLGGYDKRTKDIELSLNK